MPAIMDDPASPTIHRVSGVTQYPNPSKPELPASISPRQVTLRDRQTIATVVPFVSRDQVPASLLAYLSDQFAKEIEGGDTYPMIDPMPFEKFSAYWLQNFAGIMLLGQINSPSDVVEGKDWSRECLGSFYIKPNYPGRSSHVCNAGFLVTDAARNRGVGRLMGETYLDWAPKLGYSYSVFNLVYETNVASCRIWDALGFKRIGRVKGAGNLKSYPDRLIDAIIYGRELGTGAGEGAGDPLLVSEERFDKIKFYLKYGRYPNGSDRAEKSRLRSAATHYKLLDNDMLMLKGKEVISDPARQMAVARKIHEEGGHAGINKTTAVIAEKFHWSRIKETVSDVIRTCDQCKDLGKMSSSVQSQSQSQNLSQNFNAVRRFNHVNGASTPVSPDPSRMSPAEVSAVSVDPRSGSVETTGNILDLRTPMHHHALHPHEMPPPSLVGHPNNPYANPSDISSLLNPPLQSPPDSGLHPPHHHHHHHHHHHILHDQLHHDSAAATLLSLHEGDTEIYHPIDPHIISQHDQHSSHHHHHVTFETFHHHPGTSVAVGVPGSSPHPHTPLSGHGATTTTAAAITYHSPHLSHPEMPGHDPAVSPFDEHDPHPRHHHHHHHHTHTHTRAAHDHDGHPQREATCFQALLHDAAAAHKRRSSLSPPPPPSPSHLAPDNLLNPADDQAAVDRDLAMLIEQDDSDSPASSPPSSCLSSSYGDHYRHYHHQQQQHQQQQQQDEHDDDDEMDVDIDVIASHDDDIIATAAKLETGYVPGDFKPPSDEGGEYTARSPGGGVGNDDGDGDGDGDLDVDDVVDDGESAIPGGRDMDGEVNADAGDFGGNSGLSAATVTGVEAGKRSSIYDVVFDTPG
ncbi:hypothetical protein F5X99DRAFT_424538 [Biscogniauxia marginata]|nr:hypothetical protein F5X99DRAFT_424538 [Biscogniauxia marginata]